jgi:hypothetical protein
VPPSETSRSDPAAGVGGRCSNSPIAASIARPTLGVAQATADAAGVDRSSTTSSCWVNETTFNGLVLKNINRESIRRTLTDELRQQIARDLGFDRPAGPALVGQGERIDCPPVARSASGCPCCGCGL